MIVKPDTPIKDWEGKDMKAEGKPVLLKTILINSLSYEDKDIQPNAEQKLRAFDLGLMLMAKEEVELKTEDIVFIKQRLLKLYPALIYGQVVKILEGRSEVVDNKDVDTKSSK